MKVAHAQWSALTIKQRAAIIFKLHSLIEAHSTELAQIIVKENGKNIVEALADVAKGNETVEWASSLPQLAGGRILEVGTSYGKSNNYQKFSNYASNIQVSKGIHCEEHRVSLGVVAAIVPFNFPG